ncbi:hypothetical protein [Pimelobacter sp. 30-1]|nr:hypothetical protein [Pimelobacter sp. 30-1]
MEKTSFDAAARRAKTSSSVRAAPGDRDQPVHDGRLIIRVPD